MTWLRGPLGSFLVVVLACVVSVLIARASPVFKPEPEPIRPNVNINF